MSTSEPLPQIAISIPRAELNRLCDLYGSAVHVAGCIGPDGKALDGARLLLAMAGRESSFGKDMKPRHEPAYDFGGRYAKAHDVAVGLAKYGAAFACSYGPLQVLAVNAFGFSPTELAACPETAMLAAIGYLNRYVFGHWRCQTLPEICETWNGGHPGATTTPGYVNEVTHYYLTESPAEAKSANA
jgi:hypothetical protein